MFVLDAPPWLSIGVFCFPFVWMKTCSAHGVFLLSHHSACFSSPLSVVFFSPTPLSALLLGVPDITSPSSVVLCLLFSLWHLKTFVYLHYSPFTFLRCLLLCVISSTTNSSSGVGDRFLITSSYPPFFVFVWMHISYRYSVLSCNTNQLL